MTHVITSLCLRDNGCLDVCPVECIFPGNPAKQQPTYFIDPNSCIDCGACVPECPYNAIFPQDEVPSAFRAKGGEFLNQTGLTGHYQGQNSQGKPVLLDSVRQLVKGELVDLRASIKLNAQYAK